MGASYAFEAFAAPSLEGCCVVLGMAGLSTDLDLSRLLADGLGSLHILGFGIHDDGLSAQLEDIHGVSNAYTDEDVRVYEA